MTTAYDELLRRFDDPVRWEYPVGFDHARAVHRFQRLVWDLEPLWEKPIAVETDGDIQDASFHSQLMVPVRDGESVLVRFSNFGDMATFAEEVAVPEDLRQRCWGYSRSTDTCPCRRTSSANLTPAEIAA